MKRFVCILLSISLMVTGGLMLQGCSKSAPPELPSAKLTPPVIQKEGTLLVGIDHEYMPYSGNTGEGLKGIDVDVASLIANDLGLKIEFIEVPHEEDADAIRDGKVDMVMSSILGDADPSIIAVSGIYAEDAPSLFTLEKDVSAVETSEISEMSVGVQSNTLSAWTVSNEGAKDLAEYDTLNEAFDALTKGEVQAVACDAVVGSYLCSHYPTIKLAKQMQAADLVGAGVSVDNIELQEAVQGVVDAAREDGRLDLLLRNWVGDMLDLSEESTEEPAEEATETLNP